jgi:uncharacterized protein YndB with AHSA1/START domain
MSEIHLTKTLSAPIDEVFELLTDHAGYTRFRGFSKAELLEEGDKERNGFGALRRLVAGPFKFEEAVTAFERPTRMDYLIRKVNLPIAHEGGSIRLDPTAEGGTFVNWDSTFTTNVPLVGPVLGKGLALALHRGFVRLLDDIDRLAAK